MSRRYEFRHRKSIELREQALEAFRRGEKPPDVSRLFDIPPRTARQWYSDYKKREAGIAATNSAENQRSAKFELPILAESPRTAADSSQAFAVDAELLPQDDQPIAGSGLSNFRLAERTLRSVALNFTQPSGSVGVQAAMGLLRLVQMEAELPRHILNGQEERTIESEREEVSKMSVDQLMREYRHIIGGGRPSV